MLALGVLVRLHDTDIVVLLSFGLHLARIYAGFL